MGWCCAFAAHRAPRSLRSLCALCNRYRRSRGQQTPAIAQTCPGKSGNRDFMLRTDSRKTASLLDCADANPASGAQRYRTVQTALLKTSDPNSSGLAPHELWAVVDVDVVDLAAFRV